MLVKLLKKKNSGVFLPLGPDSTGVPQQPTGPQLGAQAMKTSRFWGGGCRG